MATRFYLPATASTLELAITSPFAWTDTTIDARAMAATIKIGDTLSTVAFTDANAASRAILFRSYLSRPLTAGQTVTGGQQLKFQCRAIETNIGNNMNLSLSIAIMASNGTTNRKTVIDAADNTEFSATTLTNRGYAPTSAATNYTTVSGDRIFIQIGTFGDPGAGSSHSSSLRLGDSAGSDLAEDETSTTDDNPWVQFNDTWTFEAPTLALTGTVTTATETDIVAGGKTVILTLTGSEWISTALFNAQRQNIINGMDSAQSEAGGWDAKVKALQGVAGVVRTSATVVTITLDAQAAYVITANETITVTIPASAISGGVGAVASPTFVVTDVSAATENQEWIVRLPQEKSRSPQWSAY